jgi:hypothetical protein
VWLPGQAWFARHAEQWGGAVAFLDPDAPGTAPGRAYDLSAEQLADVIAQEGRRSPPGSLDVPAVVEAGRLALDDGWYGTCVHLGDLDGLPSSPSRRHGTSVTSSPQPRARPTCG